ARGRRASPPCEADRRRTAASSPALPRPVSRPPVATAAGRRLPTRPRRRIRSRRETHSTPFADQSWRRIVSRTTLPWFANRSTRSMSCAIRNNPRPSSRTTFSGLVASTRHSARSKPVPSSTTSSTSRSRFTSHRTCTRLDTCSRLPRRMAFDNASVSATGTFSETWRVLYAKCSHWRATISTTRSMYRTSLGISSSNARCRLRSGRPRGRSGDVIGTRCDRVVSLERLERALARVGDLEERVELGELEQRLEVVVEIREPELPALLADFLGQGHEHAQPGTVDVSRLAEIDQELFLATLELVEHLLLELLAVAHDELPLHIHHDNFSLLPECEAHVSVSRRNSRASSGRASTAIPASPESSDCNAVIAATLIMSSVEAPRERSEHGRARPCTMGPIARACANRSTSLYAMFPASSDGNTSTFACPATALPGAFRAATAAMIAASPCNSPSTVNRTPRSCSMAAASRTRSTDGPVPLPSVLYESNA